VLEKGALSGRRESQLIDDQYEQISNNDFSTLAEVKEPAPVGKVTIVFLDILNSTMLWDKAPDAMSAVS